MGGDEFSILLNGVTSKEKAIEVVAAISSIINEPVTIDNIKCQVASSIGIAMFPDDGLDGEALLKKADLYMYNNRNNR